MGNYQLYKNSEQYIFFFPIELDTYSVNLSARPFDNLIWTKHYKSLAKADDFLKKLKKWEISTAIISKLWQVYFHHYDSRPKNSNGLSDLRVITTLSIYKELLRKLSGSIFMLDYLKWYCKYYEKTPEACLTEESAEIRKIAVFVLNKK